MDEGLSDAEQAIWRSFHSANIKLLERLDHELQQRSQLSLTDFDILSKLADAEGTRLRMSELADLVLVSRSRLTYRVDRLVDLDYVSREECEDDRRGLFATLTDTGAKALAVAGPGHWADIRAWFLDAMDPADLDRMAVVLSRVDENLSTY
jgi:DNA-binding MarR family transcriptional regulator